jgi:hypothetical protein
MVISLTGEALKGPALGVIAVGGLIGFAAYQWWHTTGGDNDKEKRRKALQNKFKNQSPPPSFR